MLERIITKHTVVYTFRFIALKSDTIIQQDAPTRLWKANLTLALVDKKTRFDVLPNDLFDMVEKQLLQDGFFGWGIVRNGEPFSVSGVRVLQPHDNDDLPADAILTISVDYRLLVS